MKNALIDSIKHYTNQAASGNFSSNNNTTMYVGLAYHSFLVVIGRAPLPLRLLHYSYSALSSLIKTEGDGSGHAKKNTFQPGWCGGMWHFCLRTSSIVQSSSTVGKEYHTIHDLHSTIPSLVDLRSLALIPIVIDSASIIYYHTLFSSVVKSDMCEVILTKSNHYVAYEATSFIWMWTIVVNLYKPV
jgi:hypothetical protein